jgi:hypothetical protein
MGLFTITQDNLEPSFQTTLTQADGTPQDLTGATVIGVMRARGRPSGSAKVSQAMTIVAPATNGVVQLLWQAGDTDTPGVYDFETRVTLASGRAVSFPGGTKDTVMIVPKN